MVPESAGLPLNILYNQDYLSALLGATWQKTFISAITWPLLKAGLTECHENVYSFMQ